MFTPAQVRNRLTEQPFKPFRLVTSSGEHYDVLHPDLLLIGATDVIIGMPGKDDARFYEDVSRVALMHVTAMEDLPVKAKKGSKSNGKK